MMRDFELYHGVALTRLLNNLSAPIAIGKYVSDTNGLYVLRGNARSAGIYIKYCTKRLSPWSFTFRQEHQDEIARMKAELGEVFLVLVCHMDGVAVINYAELKQILDENHEASEWVTVARGKRQMYAVWGKDGTLDFKVAESSFPRKILDYLNDTNTASSSDTTAEFEDNLRTHSPAESCTASFGDGQISTALR